MGKNFTPGRKIHVHKNSQTLLLQTPLGPEILSVLQSVLIKRVDLKEIVWSGTKKTASKNECPYKAGVSTVGFYCNASSILSWVKMF